MISHGHGLGRRDQNQPPNLTHAFVHWHEYLPGSENPAVTELVRAKTAGPPVLYLRAGAINAEIFRGAKCLVLYGGSKLQYLLLSQPTSGFLHWEDLTLLWQLQSRAGLLTQFPFHLWCRKLVWVLLPSTSVLALEFYAVAAVFLVRIHTILR